MQTRDCLRPETFVEALRSALNACTPSMEAMDGAWPAGVLVPLRYHGGCWHVVLQVRSYQVGQHKGEVAFPGGRLDSDDEDLLACALRETWEEMGIRPEHVQVVGQLNAVATRTNFAVCPVVGVVPHPYQFTPNPREVAEVVELPLDSLLDGSAVRHEARLQPDGSLLRRPSYAVGSYFIFGATAWILEQLLDLVRAVRGPWA